jgi:hypothetical protein
MASSMSAVAHSKTKYIVAVIAAVGVGIALSLVGTVGSASALSGSDFNPGDIISDANFHNFGSMTETQVQAFLNAKVMSCAAGATCLKNYTQDTSTVSANAQCATYYGTPAESAAEIISKVSTACKVNPQVLLVLLQKEQALVTSTAPSTGAYRSATGYGCPDTAACDSTYYGFFNQVYHAALQFDRYEVSTNFTYFPVGRPSNIAYSPSSSCGSQSVTIQNKATADLYYYTPYVPNAAALGNLSGTGNSCSSYGNRNFWVYYSTWFGSPTGTIPANGSFDTAYGVAGGIEISGWSVDPNSTTSSYIWVNVNGLGGPFVANGYLNWIEGLYPNNGPNHGFNEMLPEAAGSYQVCVFGTNSVSLGCKTVVVPSAQNAAGALDTVTGVQGGLQVSGWSLDKTSTSPSYVWINVDGVGGGFAANLTSSESLAAYPALGSQHGYSALVAAPPGNHNVCVYGTDSVLLSCRVAAVPTRAAGTIDSATGVLNGIQVSGWSLDQTTSASTYVWINVDGLGGGFAANQSSSEALAAFPNLGAQHGYSTVMAASPGNHTVCVYGTDAVALGCNTVNVPPTGAGAIDSTTGVLGGINIAGWSLDQTTSASSYVWINVDGKGGAYNANLASAEAVAAFPSLGTNHGFSTLIPASVGIHTVCVYGTQSVSLGCNSVTVPNPVVGSFDTATGTFGGVQISGWTLDQTSSTPLYIWVNVDGLGGPMYANQPLTWIPGLYPTAGINHGFSGVVSAIPGTHSICVYGGSTLLSCKTVVVPQQSVGSFDTAAGIKGGIQISGWSVDQTTSNSTYVWVDVDGAGSAMYANQPLNWIPGLYPTVGINHGFAGTVPAPPGAHSICVYNTTNSVLLSCKSVTVPAS